MTVFNRRGRGRATLGLVTLTALVSLTACSNAAGNEEGGESARVAFVQAHMASTFRTQMIAGVEEAAEAEGVDVDVYNSNNEVIKQNEAMENYVTRGVDVIAVAAIELESALPAVQEASEAGVKVIAVDMQIDDPAVSANVGVDNRAGGETMGELVAEDATERGLDGATVGIVGALNSEIQNARADGFQDAMGGSVEVVQIVDGQNRQEKAVDEAENLLTAFPDLTYIYATGEPALIGTLAAVESQGRTDVKVYGWDLSAEGIRALDNDLVEAIANQPAREEGVQAIEIAARLARGEEVERDNLLDINVITKDNVDQFRADYS